MFVEKRPKHIKKKCQTWEENWEIREKSSETKRVEDETPSGWDCSKRLGGGWEFEQVVNVRLKKVLREEVAGQRSMEAANDERSSVTSWYDWGQMGRSC